MVIGYVLVGSLAGLFASVVALLLGATFWLAFGVYVLVGSAALILLPAAQLAVGILGDRAKASTSVDHWTATVTPRSIRLSASQQSVVLRNINENPCRR